METRNERTGVSSGRVAQVFVFDGDNYLGWDCFEKSVILVGSGDDADLVLPDLGAGPARASIRLNGGGAILEDLSGAGAVQVNGSPVKTWRLSPLDAITVGRFTLKVRTKSVQRSGEAPPEPQVYSGPAACTPVAAAEAAPTPGAAPRHSDEPRAPADELARLAEAVAPGLFASADCRAAFDSLLEGLVEGGEDDAASVAGLLAGALTEVSTGLRSREHTQSAAAPGARAEEPAPVAPSAPTAAPVPPAAVAPTPNTAPAEPREVLQAVEAEPEPAPAPEPRPLPEQEAAPTARAEALCPVLAAAPEPPPATEPAPAPAPALEPETTRELTAAPAAGEEKPQSPPTPVAADWVLEVVRLRGRKVVEVRHLARGEAFDADGRGGLVPTAEHDEEGRLWAYSPFGRFTVSTLAKNGKLAPLPAEACFDGRYRIPSRGKVVLSDGSEELVLRAVRRPTAAAAPPPVSFRRFVTRSLAASAVLHVLALVAGGLVALIPDSAPPPAKSVVVQLEPPPKPPEPERAPPPKVRPSPTAPSSAPTVANRAFPKAAAPTEAPSAPSEAVAEAPAAASAAPEAPSAAASPEAGGGHVAAAPPRNVRQTGILGAMGLSAGLPLGPKAAVAAVANLETAGPARPGDLAFKVGAVVGKLSGPRSELPGGGGVGTRGASRVLGSGGAGVGGPGTVAALEKGQTGQRQVKAMVSADLRRAAQVQGGMSREEVKKVIDQHMDEVTYCYETALIADPSLMGKMTFEWRILTAGTVAEVAIQTSTVHSDGLHACIKRAIKSWQFPKPRGAEVIVSYPFIFDVVGF